MNTTNLPGDSKTPISSISLVMLGLKRNRIARWLSGELAREWVEIGDPDLAVRETAAIQRDMVELDSLGALI